MMKGVTPAFLLRLQELGIDWEDIFDNKSLRRLAREVGIPHSDLDPMYRDEALHHTEGEVDFMQRHAITPLFMLDENYPWRLLETPDPPMLLYMLGHTDLNAQKSISMVGTRAATPHGVAFCRKFVEDLAAACPDALVASGLAYGVDAASHSAAVEYGLPTVGVLAHGLQMIYPAAHRDLAKRILASGGALLSEYPSGATPYRNRFLERNRIVAALSDVTIVVESEVKGGAMATARCADSYNRDVMAVPGRPTDKMSMGCNDLIRRNRASILTSVPDLLAQTGWQSQAVKEETKEKTLFPELEGDNLKIYNCLVSREGAWQLDEIHRSTGIAVSVLMGLLSELEFDGIVARLPGNRFEAII